MKAISKESYVLKHTAAIHVENKLTLQERRVFNILIKNSFMIQSGDFNTVHAIHIKDLANLLGLKDNTNYEHLKEVVHGLVKRSLRFNILNKDRKRKWESSISILSEVHYDGGMIYYKPSQSFLDVFMRPSSYAYLNISYQNSLSSKHSLAFWEYCCEQLDTTKSTRLITDFITIPKLKELLGVEGGVYEEFKVFNNKILKKVIVEVNDKTDIRINNIITKKEGARVGAMAFNIEKLNQQETIQTLQCDIAQILTSELSKQELEEEVKEIGLELAAIEVYRSQYEDDELLEAIRVVKQNIKSGSKITNIPGYLWTLLERGVVKKSNIVSQIKATKKDLTYEGLKKFEEVQGSMNKFFSIFAEQYPDDFIRWIAPAEFISYDDGCLVLKARTSFAADYANRNVEHKIIECAKRADAGFIGFRVLPPC